MNGDTPQQKWSVNFTSLQAVVWFVSKLAATIIGLWAGIAFVAGHQFDRSLDEFHKDVKPSIEHMVDEKISIHKAVAEAPMIERLHQIENQAGQYDERLKALKDNSDRNTIELRDANKKLDRILERLADR
jgi:hypothetical protein